MNTASPMSVLVTGASGLVGRAVICRLLERGFRVTALAHRSAPPAGIDVAEGDVTLESSLAAAMQGRQAVVHAGALLQGTGEQLHLVNVVGTENVCRKAAAAGVQRVVVLSSASVYGSGPFENADEGHPIAPSYPYAESKAAGEGVARSILSRDATVLRPVTIYRTGRCPFLEFLASVVRGGSLPRGRGLNPPVDVLHAEDLADAVVSAVSGRGAGETLNVAGPAPAPYIQLGNAAASALGVAPDWVEESEAGEFNEILLAASTIPKTVSIQRAREMLDYHPARRWEVEIPRGLAEIGNVD